MTTEEAPLGYVFSMDKWTPQTIPAKRLGQYIEKLAALFGSSSSVHFQKITKGSARPAFVVDATAATLVHARLQAASKGNEPELLVIRKELNRMLLDDNCTGYLQATTGAKILIFPGRNTPLSDEVTVHESGTVEGVVMRVGGRGETVPVTIQTSDGRFLKCQATRLLAKGLAKHLFDGEVRLFGSGRWRRDQEGTWELVGFDIKSFEPLESDNLQTLVGEMRAIGGSAWNASEDPQGLFRALKDD